MRGVYERDKGSGVWHICWHDGAGKRHREKIGPKQLAIAAYRKRRHQLLLQRQFPKAWREVYEAEFAHLISSARPPRGIYERRAGSGIWHICWLDAAGKRHREKADSMTAAVLLWHKRRTGREIEPAEVRSLLLLFNRAAHIKRPAPPRGPKPRPPQEKSGFKVAQKVEEALAVFRRLCPQMKALPRRSRKGADNALLELAGRGFSTNQIEAAARAPADPLRASRWFVSFETTMTYDTVAVYHREFRRAVRQP
jgi:hypothetical protein